MSDETIRTDTVRTEGADPTLTVASMPQSGASGTIGMAGEARRSVLSLIHPGTPTDASDPAFLKDKYEFVGELGKGGVGQVLKVFDRDLKREVAMKRLLPVASSGSSAETEDALIRFVEEAQATGQLEHPNIVPVHDLGIDRDGRVYFTLKYVQGSSLKRVIRGRNEDSVTDDLSGSHRDIYSPLRMIEILISVCQAVAYAHSKGIIHRDIKPDNVMLGKYGEVLVMDWGLAKVVGGAQKPQPADETIRVSTSRADSASGGTIEGSIAGTPAYMAPEQAAGKISELDERTDIYALGAMLYEILAGEPPYTGGSALDIVERVVQGPPTSIRKRKGTAGFSPIPRELSGICERAMARRPQDRYASATALRDDLQAYLENRSVSAAPDTQVQRFQKWVRRNRRQVQSGTVSAVAVLAIIAAGWLGWREWRVQQLMTQAQDLYNSLRAQNQAKPNGTAMSNRDPYAEQMNRALSAQNAILFRAATERAMEPLRQVLDLAPQNPDARLLMAQEYMGLWLLAISEHNADLANVIRREVEAYAPDPKMFARQLNGYGAVAVRFDAADAEAFLFRFETLNVTGKDGAAQPPRRIPVPFDLAQRRSDPAFLHAEQVRIADGKPVPVDRHSIFNLEPTPDSKAGSGGKVNIDALPPGDYMMLVRAAGRVDTRISFRMDRLGQVKEDYLLPKSEENPPGFFYMAGGDVIIGGETAGAPAVHSMRVAPAWIYHDEISMGEYGAFLFSLTNNGKSAEAHQRLPKDFGRSLATLGEDGQLLPAEKGVDAAAFAKSPVRGVSYNDAQAYVAWRGQQEGLPYRLPQDWEWEAACRGADGRKYSWGDTPGKGLAVVTQGYGDNGNSMSWKWEDYKDESPWGIHNLAGGVAEWTDSLFDPAAKAEDPVFGQHTIRGNAWALPPVGLECSFRTSGQADYFHPTIGFRIAMNYPYTRTGPAPASPVDPHAGHSHSN